MKRSPAFSPLIFSIDAPSRRHLRGTLLALVLGTLGQASPDLAESKVSTDAVQSHATVESQAGSEVPASPDGHPTPELLAPSVVVAGPGLGDHVPSMTAAAVRRWSGGQHEEAELIFAELLSLPIPLEEKRDLLLQMADLYQTKDASKAIIILEKFTQTYPRDPVSSQVLLRLGKLYRDQGAFDVASARFFRVLNTTLRADPNDLVTARRNATMARFEMAEMLTEKGELTKAAEFYRKIELLDLSPEDRMTVRFRLACVAYETRRFDESSRSFAALRHDQPDGPYRLESTYYLASGLKAMGRGREAFEVVVELLSSQISSDPENREQSVYWKRRAGNELANEFYQQGDYLSALTIYQALARLSDDPEWRWPAVYQIGLCFEHLELPGRALEAYEAMLEGLPVRNANLVRSEVSLRDLAGWRLDHVKWMLDYGEQFRIMTGSTNADS